MKKTIFPKIFMINLRTKNNKNSSHDKLHGQHFVIKAKVNSEVEEWVLNKGASINNLTFCYSAQSYKSTMYLHPYN